MKQGPAPQLPDNTANWVSKVDTALGPWPSLVATGTIGRLTGVRTSIIQDGTTTTQISYLDSTTKSVQTDSYRNGKWLQADQSVLGVPALRFTPTGMVQYFLSPLRELLVEPSDSTMSWPVVTRNPATGQITQKSLPNGVAAAEEYTYYANTSKGKAGLLKSKTTLTAPSGVTYYDYNERGQLTHQWGGGDYPVKYVYDGEGRMATLRTYRSGTFTGATWPASEPTADATEWVYAPGFSQPVQKKYQGQGTTPTVYTYHSNGSLATRVWQRTPTVTTTYSYDAYARLLTVDYSDTTPDVGFTYLPTGHLATRTDGVGTTTFGYTPGGSVASETTTGGVYGTQSVTRTHDTLGRLHYLDATWGAAATMPQIEYVYDATTDKLNRVSGMSRHVAFSNFTDVNLPGTTEFKIGANPTTATTYMTRTQTVDTAGRPGYIGYNSGSTMLQSFTYAYDRYNVTGVTRENSNVWGYTYDTKGQVATAQKRYQAGQEILKGLDTTYNYDQIGNRTSVTENSSPALTTTYTPNALNQYSQVDVSARKFDVSGYRSNSSASIAIYQNGGTAQTPGYQPASTGQYFWKRLDHGGSNALWDTVQTNENGNVLDYGLQYVPPTTESPTYDADGNLLSDGRRNYVWDAENRLIEINWTAAQSPMAGYSGKITYTYDGLSRRVSRTNSITWTATNTTYYLDALGYQFDGWNHIMTVRFNSAGVTTGRQAAYVWGPDVASSYQAGRSMQGAGGVGGLLMVLDGVSLPEYQYTSDPNPIDDDYFPLMDRMGNVTGYKKASTTTPAAQLDAIYDYDAFGQEVRSTGPAADIVPYHFSTKFADASGLVYYGYRWYDAAKGRWLSRDPIEENGGMSLYAASINNCIVHTDYLGMSAMSIPAWAAGLAADGYTAAEIARITGLTLIAATRVAAMVGAIAGAKEAIRKAKLKANTNRMPGKKCPDPCPFLCFALARVKEIQRNREFLAEHPIENDPYDHKAQLEQIIVAVGNALAEAIAAGCKCEETGWGGYYDK